MYFYYYSSIHLTNVNKSLGNTNNQVNPIIGLSVFDPRECQVGRTFQRQQGLSPSLKGHITIRGSRQIISTVCSLLVFCFSFFHFCFSKCFISFQGTNVGYEVFPFCSRATSYHDWSGPISVRCFA